jgi:gluconate 5-dehydrogenase
VGATPTILDAFSLTGRRAMITGGSRGLGREIALGFAEVGADLVLVGREAASLDAAAAEAAAFGAEVATIVGDVSVPEGAEEAARRALAEHGPIDVLVNNVGGRRFNVPTEELPIETWRAQLDLNVTSAFVCTKLVGGEMVKRGSGRIVNIASISGLIANRGIAGRGYEAGKAALAAFTRAVAADWAPHGVTVNAIAPGVFLTDPNRRWFDENPELRRTIEDMVPMGRLGEPRELAPLALYLASDASSFMTGAVIVIDGGYTLW